ncbi:MAG TPA: DUF5916 domain-containing protein [Longimicrobiales bacterium]|jgi:hypothetical protein
MTATRLTGEIRLDGRLDEAAWQAPPNATGFTQAEPREGEPASERTEVWVAFDDANLYVAARLHDAEEPTVNDIRKDFEDTSQDGFQLILDTFRDRRSGYVFKTNPEGARGDAQVANEGREVNLSWDAIWRVETARAADGWTLEMEIPFRALRFDPEGGAWGVNFARLLRRNNEVAYWAPIPRSYNLFRLSLAGDLTGLPHASGGRDLRVKPFALAGAVRETGGEDFERQVEVGVDVKYRLTEGLTLDVTANPDFAQVEADEQRVNLTQFSLFFQEKREFFLENSGLFYMGDAARNTRVILTPTPDEDLLLFFSRRIGITEDGRALPIDGGVRLTGQAAGLVLGGLWMRTGGTDGTPTADWAVMRVRKNILRGSDVGGIFLLRNGEGNTGGFNRVVGGDTYIRFPGDLDWSTYYVRSETPGIPDGQYAWRTSLNREGNFHHIKLGLMQIGEGFADDLGYYRRTGIRKYFIDWGVRPRPEGLRRHGIREMHPHIVWNYIEDLDGRMVAKRLHTGYTFFLEDGGYWEVSANPEFQLIEDPFTIDRRVGPIPPGGYGWTEWQVRGSTDASATFSGGVTGIVGGLWSGTQRTLSLNGTFKPSYRFRTTLAVQRTSAELDEPDADFVKTFWTSRTNYSFNTNTFVDALVQYDPATRLLNSNVRFNFIHHPLSDVFLVWNEQRFATGEHVAPGRSLTLKVTQMVAF